MRFALLPACLLLTYSNVVLAEQTPTLDEFDLDQMVSDAPVEAMPSIWSSMRWTVSWSGAGSMRKDSELQSHRVDTRLRWEQLLADQLYVNVDGKLIFRLPDDPQLEPGEKLEIDQRLRELSLQYSHSNWNIKAGFQTIIWGEMDGVRINDVMSPWDYSEPVFTNPEDARLGQGAISWNGFYGNNSLSLIAVPWATTNRYPGGSASGLIEYMLGSSNVQVDDQQPEPGKDWELGARFKRSKSGYDLQLYAAQLIQDDPLFENLGNNQFYASYPKSKLGGLSVNYSDENFLWKAEAAYKADHYFPGPSPQQRDAVEFAMGFDYNANGFLDATIEVMQQQIQGDESTLIGVEKENSQLIARISKNFLHDTLALTYFSSYQMNYGDLIHSANAAYDINDNWQLDLNATLFQVDNDSPNAFTDSWDQVSAKISFTY